MIEITVLREDANKQQIRSLLTHPQTLHGLMAPRVMCDFIYVTQIKAHLPFLLTMSKNLCLHVVLRHSTGLVLANSVNATVSERRMPNGGITSQPYIFH